MQISKREKQIDMVIKNDDQEIFWDYLERLSEEMWTVNI